MSGDNTINFPIHEKYEQVVQGGELPVVSQLQLDAIGKIYKFVAPSISRLPSHKLDGCIDFKARSSAINPGENFGKKALSVLLVAVTIGCIVAASIWSFHSFPSAMGVAAEVGPMAILPVAFMYALGALVSLGALERSCYFLYNSFGLKVTPGNQEKEKLVFLEELKILSDGIPRNLDPEEIDRYEVEAQRRNQLCKSYDTILNAKKALEEVKKLHALNL